MSLANAYFAMVFYVDRNGIEQDQPAITVAATQEDAVRCLHETFGSNPDCAGIVAIAVERNPIPIDDVADLAALAVAVEQHNERANARASEADNVVPLRPANATVH